MRNFFRFFNNVFSNQICYAEKGSEESSIQLTIKGQTNKLLFNQSSSEYIQNFHITHRTYYIDNPFVIDKINYQYSQSDDYFNEIDNNIISVIKQAEQELNKDKMYDIVNAVTNKEKLTNVYNILKKAFSSEKITQHNGVYFYNENGIDVDFRNLSTGLKACALIERLINSGKLKAKDLLILDEPEIHLHPKWQMIYAELIVVLQKEFDLTVLINTHSVIFLQALNIAARRYKKNDIDFYLSDTENNSFRHLGNSGVSEIYKQTSNVTKKLLFNFQRSFLLLMCY